MYPEQGTGSPFVILGHLYSDAARAFSRRVGMSLSRIEVLHELMHAGEISQMELQQRWVLNSSALNQLTLMAVGSSR